MNRFDKLLSVADRGMNILEIGPSFNPVAPKSAGWHTTVVDHATREELIEKYRRHSGVDTSRIEPVDVVWTDGRLVDALPLELRGRFDLAIASHVIEHVPDLIAFLGSLELLLQENGTISLAVPDKRFCFDWAKSLSSTGQVLNAHLLRATRHSRVTAFDHIAYSISNDGEVAWGQWPTGALRFIHSLQEAKDAFESTHDVHSGPYLDYHAWHFTPSSFRLLVLELQYLGFLDCHLSKLYDTEGCEFIAILQKGKNIPETHEELNKERLELLTRSLVEVSEQCNLLPGA
ncbi:MAG: class I SAM-dependent methyltransferase [Caldilineaceae bacterium]